METTIGIDKIGFYSPEYYLDLTDLALARQVDPAKYKIGIGQDQMAVLPPDQDIVTMAANAAAQILGQADREQIDLLIFATESGIDQSKAAALYLQELLQINHQARAFEVKEACYGATAGLQIAYDHLVAHPESQKVLVVGADVARYGLATAGEVTQGAGAIALLVTRQPRLLALQQPTAYYSEEIMDFWRPNYRDTALADGKFSTEQYLRFLALTWQAYQAKTGLTLTDLTAVLFHIPFTKLGLKGLRQMTANLSDQEKASYFDYFQQATIYNRQVGNLYTGSLYLSLLSLLDQQRLPAGAQLGLYSYGSGAVAEFFTAQVQPDYQQHLQVAVHQQQLAQRQRLTLAAYEDFFKQTGLTDQHDYQIQPQSPQATFYFAGQQDQRRIYQRKEPLHS